MSPRRWLTIDDDTNRFPTGAEAEIRRLASLSGAMGAVYLNATEPEPNGIAPGSMILRSGVTAPVTPTEPSGGTTTPVAPITALNGTGNLTFGLNTSAQTVAVPTPANASVGDLLVVALAHQSAGSPAFPFIMPSGWTLVSLDSQQVAPDGNRPSAVAYYPINSAAALAALPASTNFSVKTEFAVGRQTAIMFRVTGANLALPSAGSTNWRQASSATSVQSSELVPTKQPALLLGVHVMQNSAGVGQPTISIADMVPFAAVGHGASVANTTISIFTAPLTSLSAVTKIATAPAAWSIGGVALVALARA